MTRIIIKVGLCFINWVGLNN